MVLKGRSRWELQNEDIQGNGCALHFPKQLALGVHFLKIIQNFGKILVGGDAGR